MSLPIPTSILVRGATTIASDVVKRVGQAIGFAEVLAGADSGKPDSVPSDSSSDSAGLIEQIVQAAGQTLSRSKIALNQSLQLSVQADGGVRVEQDHPQAAEIEALLESDPRLQNLARQLAKQSGSSESAIGLTIPGDQESILRTSGGYPNW